MPRLRKAPAGLLVVMCRTLVMSSSENLPSGPRWMLNRSRGFINNNTDGMKKIKKDVPSRGTFGGVGWDVWEDLRNYTKVSKSELTIDGQLVPDPSRFDCSLPDRRAYKLSPKACLNMSLVHFSLVWETMAFR